MGYDFIGSWSHQKYFSHCQIWCWFVTWSLIHNVPNKKLNWCIYISIASIKWIIKKIYLFILKLYLVHTIYRRQVLRIFLIQQTRNKWKKKILKMYSINYKNSNFLFYAFHCWTKCKIIKIEKKIYNLTK